MKNKPICIIPARGNSRRIKNKNIANFFGKPLIGHAIELAKQSNLFQRIIVTTDSKKIIKIAKKFSAETPFIRSKKLSASNVSTARVLLDCIKKINSIKSTDHFCIYPTSPLILKSDLRNAYKIYKKNKSNNLIAISDYDSHPLRALRITKKNTIKFFWSKNASKMSCNLQKLVHDSGTFYIFKTKNFLKNRNLVGPKTSYYKLTRLRSIDINEPVDLKIAKILFKYNKLSRK